MTTSHSVLWRFFVLGAALTIGTLALAQAQDDDQLPHGMDVGQAIQALNRKIGPGKPPADKPWANDLADLTEAEPGRYEPAIARLAADGRIKPKVIDDLALLAQDRDPRVRSRVTQVLAGIGGPTVAPMLITLAKDRERMIREQAALALGRCPTAETVDVLVMLLAAPEAQIREAAAHSLAMLRPVNALTAVAKLLDDGDDLVKRAKTEALAAIASQAEAVPQLIEQIRTTDGPIRDALVQIAGAVKDRRLVPVLLTMASDPGQAGTRSGAAWTQYLALQSLATCGDRRALELLCRLADSPTSNEIRTAAAAAAQAISGYRAGPGRTWSIWWQDHLAAAPRWLEIDNALASFHDPTRHPTQDQLGHFQPAELFPLVEAVLEQDSARLAEWWPTQALATLRADQRERWSALLAERTIALPSSAIHDRLGLILLIDDLGGTAAGAALTAIADDLNQRIKREKAESDDKIIPIDHAAEQSQLKQALTKRSLPHPW